MNNEVVDAVASPALWPEPDYLNPWLDFAASAIGSISWPLLIVGLALLFRKPIVKLIGRIKSAEAGGAKLEFGEEVQDLADNAQRIEPADPEVSKANDPRLQELITMATASPTGAIVEAWKDVEAAARLLINRAKNHVTIATSASYNENMKRSVTALNTSRMLMNLGLLPPAEMNTYEELRTLRNKVAHETDQQVTPLSAAQYVRVADQLVDVITQYSEEIGD